MRIFTLKRLKLVKPLFFIALFFFTSHTVFSQFYTTHYVAPAPWQYFSKANEIVIATNSTSTVNIALKKSDGTLITNLTAIKGAPAVYRFLGLPSALAVHPFNTIINAGGLIVTSDGPTSVNLRNVASDNLGTDGTDANIKGNASLTSFGDSGIGIRYRIGYYRDGGLGNFGGFGTQYPIYSIMAIKDGTTIKLNGTVLTTLNAGQSYLFQAAIGSLVESSSGTVMNTSARIDMPGGCGDGTFDQVPPEAVLGSEYFIERGKGNDIAEQTTVVATKPNTVLTIEKYSATGVLSGTVTTTLTNAGDFYTFINGISNTEFTATRVTATNNVVVYSGTAQSCEVDISVIAPVSACGGSNFIETKKFRAYNAGTSLPYFGYVLLKDATSVVNVNGVNMETLAGARYQIGSTGWYVINFNDTKIGSPDIISVSSTAKLTVSIVQQGGGFSMAGFFSNFAVQPDDPTLTYISGGGCTNVSATLTTPIGFEPYQWYLNGVAISEATSNSYTATKTGSYSVASTLTCGAMTQSKPVSVTLCTDNEVLQTVDTTSPCVGSNIEFTIKLTNLGPNNTVGLSVNDLLPSGYTYLSSTPSSGVYDSTTGIWSIGSLDAAGIVTLKIVAKVNATGVYTNTASIPTADSNISNNTASVTPSPIPLPSALSLTGSTICVSPGNNGTVTSSTSVNGVNYQLFNSTNVSIQGIKSGIGSGLTWSGISTGNGYYVVSTVAGTSCSTTSGTVNVVAADPAAPTIGTITQPTCAVPTGSVVLSGLPSSGTWTVTRTPGAVSTSGSGTSTTIGGLSAGVTYVFTVTNTGGCISNSSANVVINLVSGAPITTGVTICQGSSGSLASSSCTSVITSGANNAGSGADNSGVGTSSWSTPENISTVGSPYATQNLPNDETTHYLFGTNYGFVIPASATITGITVVISRQAVSTSNIIDNDVRLLKAGVLIGNNLSTGAAWQKDSFGSVSYGGANNLWGTTWTPAEINATDFGVALSAKNNSNKKRVVDVDYMQITVTYTVNGSVNWYTLPSGGSLLGSGSPFNPVGVAGSGLSNTNTPGTKTYYAECSGNPGCRAATDFVIKAIPTTANAGADQIGATTCGLTTVTLAGNTPTVGTGKWTVVSGAGGSFALDTNSTTTFTGTAGTAYTLRWTISNSPCTSSSDDVNIKFNQKPSAPSAGVVTQPTCSVATGSLQIASFNAASTYTFTPSVVSISASGLVTANTGSYTFTETNTTGCTSVASSSIVLNAQPTTPADPTLAVVQPSCGVSGRLTINNYNAATLYSVDGGTYGTLASATFDVTAGTHTVTAKDASSSCTSATATSGSVNATPVVPVVPSTGTITQPSCTVATGSFQITSFNGASIYTFTPSVVSISATGLVTANPGSHTFTETNASGCTSLASSAIVVNTFTCPTFSISDLTVSEGIGTAIVQVVLSNSNLIDTEIDIVTNNGTAGTVDYTAVVTTVTIPAGQTSVNVSIPILEDIIDEPTESFTVNGSVRNSNATNATASGVVSITDNDATPTLSISSPVVTEGANAVFTVSLDVASSADTIVDVVTTTGTAGTADYTAITTTVNIPAGQTSVTVSVPTTDDAIDEPSENFTLTGTVTSGNTNNTTATGAATINDNDATPTLSISSPTVVEGANAVFTLSLDVASSIDTVVNVVTTSGTAGASDYTSVTTSVTIPAGQTSATVSVPTTDDVIDESSENFTLTGTVTSGNTINTTATGTATINDNDATPTLSISSPVVTEGANAVFTLSLDVASSVDTVVNVVTISGTAGASDYTSVTTTVTIPVGQKSVTVSVPTTDDVIDEPSENFTLTGTVTSANTTNTTATGTATINDNDATPTVSIVASIANASEPSTNGQFTVTLTNPISTDTKVTYTLTGTATNGTDYATITNTVTIPANSLSATIPVTVVDDSILEGNETVIITLNNTDNGVTVNATAATVMIGDNEVISVIQANPDTVGAVVGINQTVTVINVLANDKLNNGAVLLNSVNLSQTVADPTGYMTLKPDGTVELLPNTPAGTYTLTYSICEKSNPTNCSSATVTVTVVAPTMTITANSYCSNDAPYVSYSVVANNFTPTGLLTINWIDSANRVVATQSNMPLSGNVLWPGAVVDASNNPVDWPGWLLVNGQWIQGADGYELTRPAVTMQFVLNPTQNVVVNYPAATSGCNASPRFSIKANNDDAGTIDGTKASSGVFNALANDTFNGLPINAANVTVTFSASSNFTMTAAGLLNALANIPGGTYTLTYNICEKANLNNCSTGTITVFVSSPSIGLVKRANFNDENGDGYAQAGETVTYTFEVKNKGNVPLSNITISDPLSGITITGAPLSLAVGETNTTQFKAVYVIKQTDINEGSISNQATVFGTAPNGRVVEDKSDDTDFDSDDATLLTISGCVIKVYNAVTPDGSGEYDKLVIRGLECYADNSIQIFNRWGVLVFEREHYNNDDVVFKGISEGRVTVERSQELPAGTYFYILKYRDSKSNAFEKSGYLYLNRK